MEPVNQLKAILYHKQSTSARTRFLKQVYGGVVAFEAFPKLAQVVSNGQLEIPKQMENEFLNRLAQSYNLGVDDLCVDTEFNEKVDVPGEVVPVLLVRFKSIDPPFEEVAKSGCQFINLTEARGLPPVELELLQLAYKAIMEG